MTRLRQWRPACATRCCRRGANGWADLHCVAGRLWPGAHSLPLVQSGLLRDAADADDPRRVTFVPLFVLVSGIGWVNTLQGLIVPGLFNTFAAFLFRQFYLDFPHELEDAGRVDGLGYWGIYRHILLPNSLGIMMALGIIAFIGSWNSFLWPLIIGQTSDWWTVQVVLSTFLTAQTINLPALFMGAAIAVLPLMVIFIACSATLSRVSRRRVSKGKQRWINAHNAGAGRALATRLCFATSGRVAGCAGGLSAERAGGVARRIFAAVVRSAGGANACDRLQHLERKLPAIYWLRSNTARIVCGLADIRPSGIDPTQPADLSARAPADQPRTVSCRDRGGEL